MEELHRQVTEAQRKQRKIESEYEQEQENASTILQMNQSTINTIHSLEDIYRMKGFICAKCNKPYINPQTCPTFKPRTTACAQCWKSFAPYERNLWGDSTISDQMEQIELCWKRYQGSIKNDDPDWQNELTLRAVKSANWNEVRYRLEDSNKRTWKNMSEYILVEACEHSDVPKDIIEKLLDSGIRIYNTRPCLNPGGLGAMTPVAVAAEKGAIGALEVFNERDLFGVCELDWAASCAVRFGQDKALDIIWSQNVSYNAGHDRIVTEKLYERASPGRIINDAKENGHENIINVVKKYFPNSTL